MQNMENICTSSPYGVHFIECYIYVLTHHLQNFDVIIQFLNTVQKVLNVKTHL